MIEFVKEIDTEIPKFRWLSWSHVVADWRRYRRRREFRKEERHYEFVNDRS